MLLCSIRVCVYMLLNNRFSICLGTVNQNSVHLRLNPRTGSHHTNPIRNKAIRRRHSQTFYLQTHVLYELLIGFFSPLVFNRIAACYGRQNNNVSTRYGPLILFSIWSEQCVYMVRTPVYKWT